MEPTGIDFVGNEATKRYIMDEMGHDTFDLEKYVKMTDSYFFGNYIGDEIVLDRNPRLSKPFRYLGFVIPASHHKNKFTIEYNPNKVNLSYTSKIDFILTQIACEMYMKESGRGIKVRQKHVDCLYKILFSTPRATFDIPLPTFNSDSSRFSSDRSLRTSSSSSPSPDFAQGSAPEEIDISNQVVQKIKQLTDIHFKSEEQGEIRRSSVNPRLKKKY